MWQLRIRDYAGLTAAFKSRREELRWTLEEANARAGFSDGYWAKLELPDDGSGRTLTPFSLPIVLQTLGLDIVLIETHAGPQQCQPAEKRKWKRRYSESAKQALHRSRARVWHRTHAEARRLQRQKAYRRKKELTLQSKVTDKRQTTIAKEGSNPKSRGRDRSRGKPSGIAARL